VIPRAGRLTSVLVAVLLTWMPALASGQQYEAVDDCADEATSGRGVERCTAIIESDAPSDVRAEAYSFRALGYMRNLPGGRPATRESLRLAIADLDDAIRLDPENGGMFGLRGSVRLRVGDTRGVYEDANRAIELGEREPTLYGLRGLASLRLGNPHEAVQDLSVALEDDPEYEPLRIFRATASYAVADFTGAQRDFEILMKGSFQESSIYWHFLSTLRAGSADYSVLRDRLGTLERDNSYREALQILLDKRGDTASLALPTPSGSRQTNFALAQLALVRGEDATALSYYQRTLETSDEHDFVALVARPEIRRLQER